MSKQINPAWQSWTDLQNEGGEGYNPHQKWVDAPARTSNAQAASAASRMLRGLDGNLVPAHKLEASLAKYEARLPNVTDAAAREIIARNIAHAREQLGL